MKPVARGAARTDRARMLVMRVSQLTVDPITNMPVVLLVDEAGKEQVPIWIGMHEATAIASELEKVQLKRPSTHDLMKTMLGHCGMSVARVEVRDVKDSTFYAAIVLERRPEATSAEAAAVEIDARPSDAIALALRTGAPIRVAQKVVSKAKTLQIVPSPDDASPTSIACGGDPEPGRYSNVLELLADEDFGKWKM